MEEWWEQLASARTGTCMSQYDVQLQASICLQSIVILFEHRGEGTNLEFGKRCPHFTAPSCGRAVPDSQNFWRLEVRTLFCRSNRPSSAPCVAVFISGSVCSSNPFERELSFASPSKRAAESQNFWRLSNTDAPVCVHRWAVSPALRSRSSEREKKLSNRPAASSFFQSFRPVDLKSPTDLSDIATDLTDLWADL